METMLQHRVRLRCKAQSADSAGGIHETRLICRQDKRSINRLSLAIHAANILKLCLERPCTLVTDIFARSLVEH
jgi:hypothetical protein